MIHLSLNLRVTHNNHKSHTIAYVYISPQPCFSTVKSTGTELYTLGHVSKNSMFSGSHNRCACTRVKQHSQGCLCVCVCTLMCVHELDQVRGEDIGCKATEEQTFLPDFVLCAFSQEKHPPQQQSTDTHVLLDVTCNMLLTGTDKWILQTHRNHQVFHEVYMRLVPREGVQARGQVSESHTRSAGPGVPIWQLYAELVQTTSAQIISFF